MEKFSYYNSVLCNNYDSLYNKSRFFEMNANVFGEGVNYIVFPDQSYKTLTFNQQPQLVEKDCKSPCTDSIIVCIAMCA